jgi:hypothetical protein
MSPRTLKTAISAQLTTKRPRRARQRVTSAVVEVMAPAVEPVVTVAPPAWNSMPLPTSQPFRGHQPQFGRAVGGKFVLDAVKGVFWSGG